jgi:hypothetical protein
MSRIPPPQQPDEPSQQEQPGMAPPPQEPPSGYPGMAPPVQTEAMQRPSKWPTAIGIISIIWGGLGLICSPIGLLTQQADPNQQAFLSEMPDWFEPLATAEYLVTMVLRAVLLIGGIQLLRRRPSGLGLHIAYAWLTIATAVVGGAVTFYGLAQVDLPDPVRIGAKIGGLVGILIAVAYPIFCLIWFARRRIREDIDGWRGAQLEAQGQMYQSPPGGQF